MIRILLISLLFHSVHIFQTNGIICWDGVSGLTKNDFMGRGKSDSITLIIGGKKAAAMTTTYFEPVKVEYDLINKYRYIGYFDGNHSWLDSRGSLLVHEQTHFNIQELVIRKSNKVIDSLSRINCKVNYDSLKLSMRLQKNALNAKYDNETNYGINYTQNQFWFTRISNEIENLSEYATPCYN